MLEYNMDDSDKFTLLKFEEVEQAGTEWLKHILDMAKPQDVGDLYFQGFTARPAFTRELLAKQLTDAVKLVNRQNQYIVSMEKQVQQLKSEVIVNQRAVIDLQKDVLTVKDQQLNEIRTSVAASVGDTVKSEIKSYCEAAQLSGSDSTVFDQRILKSVVKDVVAEEDRSRNLTIFGLPEESNEQICDKVSEVFLELDEKPKIEASRLGKTTCHDIKRPVKVTLTSSTTVQQILSKARDLRRSVQYKTVFICPDRSAEQRKEQKKLVLELKKMLVEVLTQRYYIKGGQE